MKIFVQENKLFIDRVEYTKGDYEFERFNEAESFDIRIIGTSRSISKGTQIATSTLDENDVPYADLDSLYNAIKNFFDNSSSGGGPQDVSIVNPNVSIEPTQQSILTELQSILAQLNSSLNVDLSKINGKFAGTFFGDDITTTKRTAKMAAKWSFGLPVFAATTTFVDNGKWAILDDPNAAGFPDGVCYFETGATAAGKCFVTTDENNRYQAGHLSYMGYTFAIEGADAANGDFTALAGAIIRGAKSLGQQDLIKEAIVWGFVRSSGVLTKRFRVYKNFELIVDDEIVDASGLDFSNLQIIEQQIGYYGIHPSIIYVFDSQNQKNILFDYRDFQQKETSVQNPDFSLGIYVENQGNTNNIRIYNGSAEFGNYTQREEVSDASGRNVYDSLSIPSIVVDSDDTDGSGFVIAYKVKDIFNTISEISSSGVVRRNFQTNLQNKLLSISASGDADNGVILNIWFIPEEDVTAVFSDVAPDVSILQRATSATVDFSNGRKVFSIQVTTGGGFLTGGFESSSQLLDKLNLLLRLGIVAVLTLQSVATTTLDNFSFSKISRDLF
jgi:hypothetical protein